MAGSRRTSPWPEREHELQYWFEYRDEEGKHLSVNKIGEKMRLSKNTVVGKMRRMGLVFPDNEEPANIVAARGPDYVPPPPPVRRFRRGEPTLPPLPSLLTDDK